MLKIHITETIRMLQNSHGDFASVETFGHRTKWQLKYKDSFYLPFSQQEVHYTSEQAAAEQAYRVWLQGDRGGSLRSVTCAGSSRVFGSPFVRPGR